MSIQKYLIIVLGAVFVLAGAVLASEKYEEDGKYFDSESDEPIYNIQADGTIDWYTYSGFRRYHAECHVCHGPDGLGSTYAPALVTSLKTLSYDDFWDVVINGREVHSPDGSISKMPSFGTNVNVTCYLDDIYVYLKARSDEKIGRGRPRKRDKKTETAKEDEKACLGF